MIRRLASSLPSSTSLLPIHRQLFPAMLLAALLLVLSTANSLASSGPLVGSATQASPNATFVVNDSGDAGDADTGDGQCDADLATPGPQCTLRAAIQQANAQVGLDAIHFNLPAGGLTIQPAAALPEISEAAIVDGSTQPGAVCPTPLVQVDGSLTSGATDGLVVSSGGSTVRGLIITRFPDAGLLLIWGAGNTITCNLIGTDATGSAGLGNGFNGVDVFRSDGNTIGGSIAADRNVVSGNGSNGVQLSEADQNSILGNIIGVDPTGGGARPNGGGIRAYNSVSTTIGGPAEGAGNLISGNNTAGIKLESSDSTVPTPTLIQGNRIGTDAAGLYAIPNRIGIEFREFSGATVGGTTASTRNLISGNTDYGISFDGRTNLIQGNWIGPDATGLAALPNGIGIYLTPSWQGVASEVEVTENVVSGNADHGIKMQEHLYARLAANLVGVAADGETALGNGGDGVNGIASWSYITGNVIAANGGYGIALDGYGGLPSQLHSDIVDNAIGASADGSPLHPNALGGIRFASMPCWTPCQILDNHIIGNGGNGITALGDSRVIISRNAIADNTGLGIDLDDDGVTPNDPGDADGGPNLRQNFPVVQAATATGDTTEVTIAFAGKPNTDVGVAVFSSPTCDPSGYGEGARYLGGAGGTTNASGAITSTVVITQAALLGQFVTATATGIEYREFEDRWAYVTSEFSACVPVQAPPCTPGPHSGTISADEWWCAADSPHQLTGDVTVAPGVTLTVEPGAVVKGATTVELQVQGHLEAIGVPAQPITFTSSVDTAYNQWSGIVFEGGTGELDYATVRYGGRPNSINPNCTTSGLGFNIAARNVLAGEVRIRHSQIRSVGFSCNGHSPDYGLYVNNSRVSVENTTFANNGISNSGDYAIYVTGVDSSLNLAGNIFTANRNNRVLLASNAMTAADFTFVDEEGLESYELAGDLTVPAGITMTVEPGVMMMGRSGVEVQTLGHLAAVGTPIQPITFTSSVDTAYNQWSGIVFEGGTGELDYTTVRYGGQPNSINPNCTTSGLGFNIAVRNVQTGEVRIRNSQVRSVGFSCNGHSPDYGLYVNNSRVTVENTTFANNGISATGDYAIYVVGAASMLSLTDNTFVDNSHNRVLVAPGAMTGADVTFVAEDGLESYELSGDFTVPLGITLTVEPGVMVMARDTSVELNVQGHLQGIGTPTQPITFTSAANSGSNQWAGIVFDGTAGGGTGDLDYATVRYGGRPNSLNSTCGSGGTGFNIGVRNVQTGEVRIRNSQVRSVAFSCNFDSHDYGLYVNNSRVTVQNTLFANNGNSNTSNPSSGDFALYASGASTVLTFDGNVVRNNRRGLQLNGVGAQTLRNNVFKDNPLGGVYVAASAQAQLLHTTFTGNGGDAVTVASGGSAALTNSILANNTTGVRINTGGAGTLDRTLWYGNGTNTVGTVGQTGSMTGEPLFAGDGYHLSYVSPALEQGVDAGVAVDIDGEARPLPAGTGPDLGADEFDAAQELIFAKIALPPVWEVTGAIPGGSMTQRYLLPFRYGSPDQNAAPLDVTVTDTLPPVLSMETQTHWPPMAFSQNGQTLTWQTQTPLARGQSGLIDITTSYANPQPGQVLTNTAALNALTAQTVSQVPFYAPILLNLGSGELCPGSVDIRGQAQPGVTVHLFLNGAPLAQIPTNAAGEFSTSYSYAGSATETLTAQACLPGGACSALSSPVTLRPPLSFWCPQRSSWEGTPTTGPMAGEHLVFNFRNASGELSSQNWRIPGVYGFWNTTLHLRTCNCPPASGTTAPPSSVWLIADGHRFDPTGSHPDYTFAVTGGAHNVVFWANCGGNFVSSTGIILIDPDGYVFDVTQGFDPNDPTAHAIPGVTVTLYWNSEEWGGWTPWPAHLYNNQVNPQVTGGDGYFAFFTPPGQYYLQVDGKPGYQPWRSPVITVVNEIVHVNVPYTPWTGPAETVTSLAEVVLTADGPQPAAITVALGDTVQWRAEIDGLSTPALLAQQAENPALRPLSSLDPISHTLGWDGGMLAPGQVYRREMNTPGRYTYTDGQGHQGEICVSSCEPLGVTLADFYAQQVVDFVLVTWETASELSNRGFNLYRGTSPAGPDRQLNTTLIPSQSPGSPGGFVYTWEDRAELTPGATYFYWVEDVDLAGAATRHGPVSVTLLVPTAVSLSGFEAGDARTGQSVVDLARFAAVFLAVSLGVVIRLRRAARSSVPSGR